MPRTRRSSHIVSTNEAVSTSAETSEFFEKLDEFEAALDSQEEDNTVAVVLLRAMVVEVIGKSTGRRYVFNGAGSVINDVDRTDAEYMISKDRPPSCCGSYPTPYFQIIGR